jgi:hypothetical protein
MKSKDIKPGMDAAVRWGRKGGAYRYTVVAVGREHPEVSMRWLRHSPSQTVLVQRHGTSAPPFLCAPANIVGEWAEYLSETAAQRQRGDERIARWVREGERRRARAVRFLATLPEGAVVRDVGPEGATYFFPADTLIAAVGE